MSAINCKLCFNVDEKIHGFSVGGRVVVAMCGSWINVFFSLACLGVHGLSFEDPRNLLTFRTCMFAA